MPRLVASYAEVLRDHHVQPLGAQIGACLGASDRRELDLIYRLERPYGASSFTLRSFDAYYHVRHGGTLMDPGYSYLFEAPDANTLTSDVAACLNRVIRAQPLPAPYGMDSGANMYEARVTFTAPAPSRSRSSRRH
ncbi:hypothetical protein KBA73_00740 [Patescibacteria group bacterium]|nr:hypothetical protein [Patescibacteria group bacterium]